MNPASPTKRQATLPPLPLYEGQAARLRGVLKRALQEAMAVGLGLGLGVAPIGCGGDSFEPTTPTGGVAGHGGQGGGGQGGGGGKPMPTICEAAAPALGCDSNQVMPDFARFSPSENVQYWARGRGRTIHLEHGRSCALTENPAQCQTAIDEALNRSVRPASSPCVDETCDPGEEFLLARGEDDVFVLKTSTALAQFLAPIDSVAEATAVAQVFAHAQLQCKDKRSGVWCEGDAFTIVALQDVCGGENVWLKVKVPHTGAAPSTEELERIPSGCAIGRLPDGCVTQKTAQPAWSSLADFWSSCASLEAASVPAFHLLAEDLRRLGAPETLIAEAVSSANDEIIHAALVLGLASRQGATSQEVLVPSRAPKSLFEMAHENAVEGCVRETFGAFVAAYQAQMATDARTKAVLQRIAKDEMKHATLSHSIAAWAEPQLSDEERTRIAQDRRQLIMELRRSTAVQHANAVYEQAGYPDTHAALHMLDVLQDSVWS